MANRDVVEFVPNTPTEVALKFPTGKIVESQFGQRVMYSLSDNRVMFHDLGFAERINNLKLKPGETFFICLKWTGKRGAPRDWDCWLSPATEKARAKAEIDAYIPEDEPADARDVELREKLQDSIIYAQMRKQQQSQGPVAQHANGTGTYGPKPQQQPHYEKQIPVQHLPAEKFGPKPQQQPGPVLHQMPPAQKLPPMKQQYAVAFEEFLVLAGRATSHAEKALSQEGASIRFDSRDIAAIATSMFIEAGKKDYLMWTPGGQQG